MKVGARYVVKQYWHPIGWRIGPRRFAVRYWAYTSSEAIAEAHRQRYPACWVERVGQPATLSTDRRRARAARAAADVGGRHDVAD